MTGKELKEWRLKRDISIDSLAETLGKTTQEINAMENDNKKIPIFVRETLKSYDFVW